MVTKLVEDSTQTADIARLLEATISEKIEASSKKKAKVRQADIAPPVIAPANPAGSNQTGTQAQRGKISDAVGKTTIIQAEAGANASKPAAISVHTYLQPEDWGNGQFFVFDQASPNYVADMALSEKVFKAMPKVHDRSPDTAISSRVKEDNKERIIFLADEMVSQNIDDEPLRIMKTYAHAIEEAAAADIQELVVMPCYPEDMNKDDRKRAEKSMLETLFMSQSLHPEMRIKLIARSSEEEQALEALRKGIAKHF